MPTGSKGWCGNTRTPTLLPGRACVLRYAAMGVMGILRQRPPHLLWRVWRIISIAPG
jgi:hypothetical protein